MIARDNNISIAFGVLGVALQLGGGVLWDTGRETFGISLLVIGTALLIVGLAYYARAKGQHPAWALLGFLSFIGLIVLSSLRDRTGDPVPPSDNQLIAEASKFGRASCIAFGLAVLCVVIGAIGLATLPAPTGGGEFRGLNSLGQALWAFGLLIAAWMLSILGCALGFAGIMQPRNTDSSTYGLALNFLAAVAGSLWFFSQ